MRGEFIAVWPETWDAIWQPVAEHEASQNDLFCELYRAAAESNALRIIPSPEVLADFIDDPLQSMEAFKSLTATHFAGERAIMAFLERAFDALEEQGGDALSNYYFGLVEDFITRFSLRYDLRRPLQLCPSLAGIFANWDRELRTRAAKDDHLHKLFQEFESAVRDIRGDPSDSKIKTCISKQINFMEALGQSCLGVTRGELGGIANQVKNFPHKAVSKALGNLYGFASDYPGLRHGGKSQSALRKIDMRDLIAMTIALSGFAHYLCDEPSALEIYQGRGA